MTTQGYTYTLVMLPGSGPFVFCRYYGTDELAIEEVKVMMDKDDDIDYILLRKGGNASAEDPVIWDSRVQEKTVERDVNGDEVNTNELNELWESDPDCIHDIQPQPRGGVKCTKCRGWFCY